MSKKGKPIQIEDFPPDLRRELRIIALDQRLTLRQLVIDVLSAYRNKQKGSK
jgi:hypothetical protein